MRKFFRFAIGMVRILLCGLLLVVAIIAALEAVFILIDIAAPIPLFVDNPFSDTPAYAINPGYYQQFMYRLGGVPTVDDFEMWGFSIPKTKEPGTCRIIVLGGSAAFGHPTPAYGFHEILKVMLKNGAPELNIELYNLACPILNAYVMREVAEVSKAINPDLFIVYMGNNEYDGPFGPAWHSNTFWANVVQQPFLRFSRNLRSIRFAKQIGRRMGMNPWENVDGEAYFNTILPVAQSTRSRENMQTRFETYITGICAMARNAGAQVVLSSVGTNLKDWPPFVSRNAPTLSPQALTEWACSYQLGQRFEQSGDIHKALDAYAAAEKMDSKHAGLQFRLGKCRLALGEITNARKAFETARDYDCYPFRADSFLNKAIRRVADRHAAQGVHFADAETCLNECDSNGISGNGLFYDNVHLLFPGNYAVAACLFGSVAAALRGAGYDFPTEESPLTSEECKERLGLCAQEYHRHYQHALGHLKYQTGVAAFQSALKDHDTGWLENEVSLLLEKASAAPGNARSSLEKAIHQYPDNCHLCQSLIRYLVQEGDTQTALIQAGEMATSFKERLDVQLLYARVLESSGDIQKSNALLTRLNALIHWDLF